MQSPRYVIAWDFDGVLNNLQRYMSDTDPYCADGGIQILDDGNTCFIRSNNDLSNYVLMDAIPFFVLTLNLLHANGVKSVCASQRVSYQEGQVDGAIEAEQYREIMGALFDEVFGKDRRFLLMNEAEFVGKIGNVDTHETKQPILDKILELKDCVGLAKQKIILVDDNHQYGSSENIGDYGFIHTPYRGEGDAMSYENSAFLCEILFKTVPINDVLESLKSHNNFRVGEEIVRRFTEHLRLFAAIHRTDLEGYQNVDDMDGFIQSSDIFQELISSDDNQSNPDVYKANKQRFSELLKYTNVQALFTNISNSKSRFGFHREQLKEDLKFYITEHQAEVSDQQRLLGNENMNDYILSNDDFTRLSIKRLLNEIAYAASISKNLQCQPNKVGGLFAGVGKKVIIDAIEYEVPKRIAKMIECRQLLENKKIAPEKALKIVTEIVNANKNGDINTEFYAKCTTAIEQHHERLTALINNLQPQRDLHK